MTLVQNRLKQAEFTRTVWSVTPEPGTTREQVLTPSYWAHVAKSLRPGDRIEVTPEGAEWLVELYVRSATPTSAVVFVLRDVTFGEAAKPAGGDYEVKHRGSAGWSVIRKSDKTIAFEKGENREQAEAWVAANTELA
jgi:hypothetical protein